MWPMPASIISRGLRPVTSSPSMGSARRCGRAEGPAMAFIQLALPVGVDAGQTDDLAGSHLQLEAAHGG